MHTHKGKEVTSEWAKQRITDKTSDHVIKYLCSQDTYDLESILSMFAYANYLVVK